MVIQNVQDMVHAYTTSPSLRSKIDVIMATESENVVLSGNSKADDKYKYGSLNTGYDGLGINLAFVHYGIFE